MRRRTRAALSAITSAIQAAEDAVPSPDAAVVPPGPADLPLPEASDLTSSVCSGCLADFAGSVSGSPPPPLPSLDTVPVDPPPCGPADVPGTVPSPSPAQSAAAGAAMASPAPAPPQSPAGPGIAVHGPLAAVRTASSGHRGGSRLVELFVFAAGGAAAVLLGQAVQMVNVEPVSAHVSVEYPQFTMAERAAMTAYPAVLPSDDLPPLPNPLTITFTPFRSALQPYDPAEAQRRTAQYVSTSTTEPESHPEHTNQEQTPSDNRSVSATSTTAAGPGPTGSGNGICGLDLYCGSGD